MQIQDFAKAIHQSVLRRTETCLRCALRRGGSADQTGYPSSFCAALVLFSLFFIVTTAIARTKGPRHPQTLPEAQAARKPAPEVPPIVSPANGSSLMEAVRMPLGWPEPQPSLPDLPAQVAIPAKQHIPVVLDTPLSTVDSKQGQIVTFRTLYSVLLDDGLEIPAETQILGHVVEVKRPAHFGREGELRLAVDRIRLDPDGGANLVAHLDSDEMNGQGRFTNYAPHSTDLHPVAIDSAGSALMGAVVDGARGAGIGAATGAAIAVLVMKSPRGQDVYLEQGMRFAVILDRTAYLSGSAVYAAQQEFKKNPQPSTLEPDSENDGLPHLKRRRPPHK